MTTVPPISQVAALEQRAFRSMLSAMAMPGTVEQVTLAPVDGPWGAAVAIAQSLLDHEVTFHVAAQAGPEETILRRTGSRTASLDRAGYVFADASHALTAVQSSREGLLEEPEHSATVVLLVDAVGGGELSLALAGPGVDGSRTLSVSGLDAAVVHARNARCAPFPSGIDVLLVDPQGRLAALPRSTSVTLVSEERAQQEVS